MADTARPRAYPVEQRVLLAVDAHLDDVEDVAGRLALTPELVPRRRPQHRVARAQGFGERLAIGIGDVEHFPAAGILKDDGFDLNLAGYDDKDLDALLNGWSPDMDKIDKVQPDDAPLTSTIKVKCQQESAGTVEQRLLDDLLDRREYGW